MALKRVEVIGDDEDEIIEATRRMSKNYDFVVTSGGIGPTYAAFPHRDSELADLTRLQTRRYNISIHSEGV